MRGLLIAVALAVGTGVFAQVMEIGGRYAINEYRTVNDAAWIVTSMDEGCAIHLEGHNSIVSARQIYDLCWMQAGCGYDPKTETFDTRSGSMIRVSLPLTYIKGTKLRFECPPGAVVTIYRMTTD